MSENPNGIGHKWVRATAGRPSVHTFWECKRCNSRCLGNDPRPEDRIYHIGFGEVLTCEEFIVQGVLAE